MKDRSSYLNGLRTTVVSTTGSSPNTAYGPVGTTTAVVSSALVDFLYNTYSVDSPSADRTLPNPQRYSKQVSVNHRGTRRSEYHGAAPIVHTRLVTGYHESATLYNAMSTATAENKALEKLYEQLRGSVDLSVSLAQGGQVLKMIRDAGKLSTYVKGFSRKTWANSWLEYQYGWKPLIMDLHGSISQLANRAGNLLTLKARASDTSVMRHITSGGFNQAGITQTVQDQSVWCEYMIQFQPGNSALETIARLSSLNPASIAWELVPYSFVVDWFYDVGGYLRNLETALAYPGSLLYGYKTVVQKNACKSVWTGLGKLDANYERHYGTTNGTVEVTHKNRVLLTRLPLPRLPTFRVSLGASRLISAASLLAQHLGLPPRERVPKRRITTVKWRNAKRKLERVNTNPWDHPSIDRY